jgi:acyl-CoA synthetase (AMP-forming)/AMP-acid ligase II
MSILPRGADLNIAGGVREFAKAAAQRVAVVDGDRSLTYAALNDRANRVATAVLDAGVRTGERVAVLLGNRLEYPEIAAGLAKAAIPMVPLNPRLTPAEARYILEHSESRALILDDSLAGIVGDSVDDLGIDMVLSMDGDQLGPSYEDALSVAQAVDPAVPVSEMDPFCVAYTSGTTGKPKGVVISHRSRCLTMMCTALEWGLGPGRRTIAVAPMYHGAGFAFAYAAVFTGGTVSMLRKWDPEALLAMIERDRAQTVFLVPTHAQMLRALGSEQLTAHDLSSLETLYFNAAPMPMALKEWVMDTWPQVGLHECYGSTEAAVVSDLRPDDQRRKPGSVGPPWFMTEVRLYDLDGNLVEPPGTGVLYSRSPFLMNGYLKDEAATHECTTPDGFLTAGDVATIDEDGCIFIIDRVKDLIISGGVNIYPREVEEVLFRHPQIADVAVVGTPDEQWGEQVAAVVTPMPGASISESELDEWCRRELAGYKIPKRYVVVDALPRNASGKILKRDLRDRLSQ